MHKLVWCCLTTSNMIEVLVETSKVLVTTVSDIWWVVIKFKPIDDHFNQFEADMNGMSVFKKLIKVDAHGSLSLSSENA